MQSQRCSCRGDKRRNSPMEKMRQGEGENLREHRWRERARLREQEYKKGRKWWAAEQMCT
jgi:hypothetical protein